MKAALTQCSADSVKLWKEDSSRCLWNFCRASGSGCARTLRARRAFHTSHQHTLNQRKQRASALRFAKLQLPAKM